MAHLKIHGFVQVRNTNRSKHTRASQWKEAVIEIVERKQNINLVVSFKLEERRRVFQLGDNVADVVVRGCEPGLYHLHLTLKNDTSILIDKLSSTDVEHLRSFLDSFNPYESQQPVEPKGNRDTLENTNPFCREHKGPVCGSLNPTPESGALLPQKMPLSVPCSTRSPIEKERGEKRGKKRKTKSSSPSRVEMNEDILKGNNPEPKKKSKTNYSRNKSKGKKPVVLREQEKHNIWKPSFGPNSYENPNLGDAVLPMPTGSDERNGSKLSQETSTHNRIQIPPGTYLKLLKREGFPNLGNTCYMNSILQSVFGIPTFAKDLITQGIPWEKVSYDDLIMPLSQLLVLKDIQDIEIKGELLINVKKSISMVAKTFLDNGQKDAHEFLSLCLDQLKLNIEKLNSMWNSEMESQVEKPPPPMYAGAAATKRFVCPVVANFEIELHLSITCRKCHKSTLKTEVSNCLSLDLHHGANAHPLSIQKSFDLYFTPEKVIDHDCTGCTKQNIVRKYTLRRPPKVLIVHLKRYQFIQDNLSVKNQQPVEISKYLNISSHCHEYRKPSFPVANTAPKGDHDVPNVTPGKIPETLKQSMPSRKVASEVSELMVLQAGSNADAEVQNVQRLGEGTSEQQLRGLESGSKMEPELVEADNRMLREKTWPAHDSMMSEGSRFLPTICESISIQEPGLTEMGLQEVPKDPELKNYEKINVYGKSDCHATTELSKYFCDLKGQKVLEGSQEMTEQLPQNHGNRIKEESFLQASPPSIKSAQEDIEKGMSRSSEFGVREDDPNSLDALDSDNHPENNSAIERGNTLYATESKNTEMGGDPQNYRLVGVVSHVGNSPDEGHYISDVYDFQKQAWLLYDDVQVFEVPDPCIQEDRRHNGYIFFYMHNGIFEELSKKASECKFSSTSKKEKKEVDLFSTLLNGLTYILEKF